MSWWDWLIGDGPRRQLDRIERKVDTIMALVDDLRTALANVTTTVGAIEGEVTAVATEVKDLIARLSPGSTITQADVDALNGIGTRLSAASDALKAIPPEPA